jgi:cellulose synthase operon protein C
MEPTLRNELSSVLVLLKARAELALGREVAALETLKRLRAEHLKSDAAIHSYLIEAAYYESKGRIVDAQLRLTNLIDNPDYRDSELVPYAYFNLALLSEQLGRLENLKDANKRIEDLVAMPAAAKQVGLIFVARLEQGHLLRLMNQFGAAQQAYEDLVIKYPRHPDVVYAQLALAETRSEQAAAEPEHAERAQLMFEELLDRADAPLDVRVEAGYNLGLLLAGRGQESKAVEVWWRDVVTPFLINTKQPIEYGAKRRYWLARTLNDLGMLHEKQGRLEEAKQVYRLLWTSKLGYEVTAKTWLDRYGVPTGPM